MAHDIFAMLTREHREVLDLFKTVERAADPGARGRAFERLRDTLEAHSVAEKEVLYARLRPEAMTRTAILEAEQEHHVLNTLLRELGRMKPSSERFLPKLHVLRELVRHHVDEEESDLFPMARQLLGAEITELAERYRERRAIATT